MSTSYKYATVNGRQVFYREAGDPALPTILLLHGFPTSSFMFRDLIPQLADRFHVVAPDYIGFGQSDAPDASEFDYSFDNLADHVDGLINQLGLTSYLLYMQDYGGPIGFRLFTRRPDAVKGFIIQNTNAYMAGVGELPAKIFLPLWEKRDAASEAAARGFLAAETTRFQYQVGAKNPEAISPDNWTLDQALLDRPGHDAAHLDLLENYKSNVALYDSWHAAFRAHQPKSLIVWGRHDPFFIPAGAEAFLTDLPQARLVWLDAGHFVLDENAAAVAAEIKHAFLPMPMSGRWSAARSSAPSNISTRSLSRRRGAERPRRVRRRIIMAAPWRHGSSRSVGLAGGQSGHHARHHFHPAAAWQGLQ